MLVPAIQRPCSVCLAVPDPGDVGLGPDGLVLEIWPLLEERDGHSIGDVSDADLVLDVFGDPGCDVLVEMGLGFGPDGIWYGHGVSCVFLEAGVDRTRVGFGGGEGQGG